jgi:two-component system copper resistance phosphate regulon response regulator CusR
MKILVVEDEPKVASFIKSGLEEFDYEVEVVYDGMFGKRIGTSKYFDIIIMDVILPYLNGIELCKQIKEVKPNTPILMLTALGTTDDKVNGFNAGADDYLLKPFEFAELVARIRALTKRINGNSQSTNVLQVGDLTLDLNKKIAVRSGKTIELTAKEFALLEYFILNKGRVLSRRSITEKVWDIDFETQTNVVDVYVNILRKKIDRDFPTKLIHTRINMGYIFNED